MSVFPSDNSPTAQVIPPETNKNPENVTRKEWETAPDVVLPEARLPLSFSFFLLLLGPTLTSFFMHNRNTNDYPISIHSQTLSPLPSTSLLPMYSRFPPSHFSHFASLFQPTSNSPAERLNKWKNERMKWIKAEVYIYIYCTYICAGFFGVSSKYIHMGWEGKRQMEERLKGKYSVESRVFSFSLLPRSQCVLVWVQLLHSQVNTHIEITHTPGWMDKHTAKTPCSID